VPSPHNNKGKGLLPCRCAAKADIHITLKLEIQKVCSSVKLIRETAIAVPSAEAQKITKKHRVLHTHARNRVVYCVCVGAHAWEMVWEVGLTCWGDEAVFLFIMRKQLSLHQLRAFFSTRTNRLCSPGAPPSNQPSHMLPKCLRITWWAPVSLWLLPCPSRSSEASSIAFGDDRLGEAASLRSSSPPYNDHVSPQRQPRATARLARLICHGVMAVHLARRRLLTPHLTRRAILPERGECRFPGKRLVLASPVPTNTQPPADA